VEPSDPVEETFDQVALFMECPVDRMAAGPGRVQPDLRRCTRFNGDGPAKVIGIMRRVRDHMGHAVQAFDQVARLRTVAPPARRDRDTDGQPERIDRGVDLRRQAAFGATDAGSFKPPF